MINLRPAALALVVSGALAAAAAAPVTAQTAEQGPRLRSSLTVGRDFPQEREPEFIRYYGRPVVRVWQDYVLPAGNEVRGVLVVLGDATVHGRIDGDLVVVLGSAQLASTAVVGGSLIVIAGNATIADGAQVRQDLVVIGGELSAPTAFSPGHEYFVVGAPWLGDRVRAIVPWITRGLLWGRPIVPDLPWVWWLVLLFLIVSLAVNLLMHGPVGACAETLARKPLSTFLAGLLVLLLTGPICLLLAASVIGLAIVPFFICAVLVAWIVGRVGVARWIGRSVTRQEADETPLEGARSFLIGFAALILLYMVPIVGLITWAMVGVFGLGAASLTFFAGLRRERPPAPVPPVVPAAEDAAVPLAAAVPVVSNEPVPPFSPPPGAGLVSPRPAADAPPPAPGTADLTLLPRATFLDRTAAFALDVLLVIITTRLLDLIREDGAAIFLMFGYFIGFWAWKGTTIGGIICNLRLVRVDGAPLRFVDAVVRALSAIFSFAALGLGCFWILRDPESQAWHDKIAGTYVVKVPRNWPLP